MLVDLYRVIRKENHSPRTERYSGKIIAVLFGNASLIKKKT